jgi:hypothetical protein
VNGLFTGEVRSRKLLFSLIAIVICVIFVCGTVTALTALSTSPENPKIMESSISTPTPTPSPKIMENPQITVNQQGALPGGCISSDQALQIALPYINQYVAERNLTIKGIEAKFNEAYKDAFHEKTGQSLSYPDDYAPSYPVWFVLVSFDSTPEKGSFLSYGYGGIIGYSVGIWADNSQVFCHEEFPVC